MNQRFVWIFLLASPQKKKKNSACAPDSTCLVVLAFGKGLALNLS